MNKKRITRIMALVIVFCMIFTTAVFAWAPNAPGQLKRVQDNYQVAAQYMKEKGYIKGYGDNEFGFTDYVKRGDIAVMIARSFKLSVLINEGDINFGDVDEEAYFYEAILTAKKLGIAKGDGKNFNPNKYVTVEEAILMIERSVAVANDNVMEGFEELYENFDAEEIGDELRDIFEDDLNEFATRQDIALMLYFVLTGDEFDGSIDNDEDADILDIVYTIDENDEYKSFDEDDFVDAFKVDDEELEYVKFVFPVRNGTLYYDYNETDRKHTLVDDDTEYYPGSDEDDLIDEITFVPRDGFEGTVYIKYMATSDDDNTYSGLIKITVNIDEDEEETDLDLIKYTMNENTMLYLKKSNFDDSLENYVFDEDEGTLYFDDEKNNDIDLDDDDFKIDDDEFDYDELGNIVFVPDVDFTGVVVIEYTAIDGDDTYTGKINITVKEVQEIGTIELSTDEEDDLIFDFVELLDDKTDSDEIFKQSVFDDIDYVKFVLPDEGTLLIDKDGYEDVDDEDSYPVSIIDGLKYEPVDDDDSKDETIEINFTVFEDEKEYDGVIKIKVID